MAPQTSVLAEAIHSQGSATLLGSMVNKCDAEPGGAAAPSRELQELQLRPATGAERKDTGH